MTCLYGHIQLRIYRWTLKIIYSSEKQAPDALSIHGDLSGSSFPHRPGSFDPGRCFHTMPLHPSNHKIPPIFIPSTRFHPFLGPTSPCLDRPGRTRRPQGYRLHRFHCHGWPVHRHEPHRSPRPCRHQGGTRRTGLFPVYGRPSAAQEDRPANRPTPIHVRKKTSLPCNAPLPEDSSGSGIVIRFLIGTVLVRNSRRNMHPRGFPSGTGYQTDKPKHTLSAPHFA